MAQFVFEDLINYLILIFSLILIFKLYLIFIIVNSEKFFQEAFIITNYYIETTATFYILRNYFI